MKVTLPEKVTGARDALFVLEVEFPVATAERTVEVGVSGPVEPLDLSGSSRGGTYRIPVGLERLHVPMRVLEDGDAEATITVACIEGPESSLTDHQKLILEAPGAAASGAGKKRMLLGGGALAAVALLAFFLAGRGSSDVVPNVRGQAEAEARAALDGAGYVVRPTYDRQADSSQDGRVIRQVPEAGTATPTDRIIELVIGRAVEQALRVPAVVGDVEESAERTLEGLGYQVIVTEQDNDDPRMAGRVVEQLPPAGDELAVGGQVEIVIARAPAFVLLPDLVGHAIEDAERALGELGLLSEAVVEPTSEVRQDGLVVTQAPLPGSQLDLGAHVTLTVGRASAESVEGEAWSDVATPPGTEPPGPVPLPVLPTVAEVGDGATQPAPRDPMATDPVQGDPLAADPASLDPGPVDPGPVDQGPTDPVAAAVPPTPAAPLERDADGQITIPDFGGWTKDDAVQLLRDAGLQPIVTLTPVTSQADKGRVIRQRPGAGVKRSGGMVFLTVGEGGAEEAAPAVPSPADLADAPLDPLAPTRPGAASPSPEDGTDPGVLDEVTEPAAGTDPLGPATNGPRLGEGVETLPDVVGLQQAAAEALLVELGFIVQATPQPTEYPPPGTVLGQDPPAGEALLRGGQVRLDVAAAPGTTRVPVPAPTAVTAPVAGPSGPELPGPELPGPELPGPEPMPEGVVRVPSPPSRGRGAVPPVRLPARNAPKTATVPNVRNATVQDAVIRILQAGLIPIIEMDRGGASPAGRIGDQTPPAVTPALLGDLVRLRVGAPPRTGERMVDLPTVIGADLDAARRIFAGTRTGLEIFEIRVPNHPYAGTGRVAAQYPVSSMPRAQAGKVTLFIVGR